MGTQTTPSLTRASSLPPPHGRAWILALSAQAHFDTLSTPYLLLIAGSDTVVDNRGSDMLEASASTGETRRFPEALHGLLCEPADSRKEIEDTIKSWALQRVK